MTDRERIEREAGKREAAERARRLARIFGDVLPDQTSDDRDGRDGSDRDEEIRRDVPPHHG